MDFIVTSNELEALILEAVLIKKHRPRYNVLLRDDKQYPYIKLTVNEEWPSILMVRKIADDGAKYFGPYRSQTVRDIFKLVKRLFRIRWCKAFKKKDQPCFYYHMGKCLAPCIKDVPRQKYLTVAKDIELFLEGKNLRTKWPKLRGTGTTRKPRLQGTGLSFSKRSRRNKK
jgi:excinuclease ABC subunit C